MSPASVQASLPYSSIGNVLAVIVVLGVIAYVVVNVVFSGKREIGSEIEIAANRKPYLSDDELEGPKLDRTLTIALGTLFLIAIALPLYWILEPTRQSNASKDFDAKFVKQGALMFAPVGDNLAALGCAGCHGGMKAGGGTVQYNLSEPDGSVKVVNWKAPALNTVLLRYTRQEVTYILTYGRPFSPMPAWGVTGGGPLNDQQIQNLVDYLETIQISSADAQQQARDELTKAMALKNPDGTPVYASEGEALFNLGLTDGFAGGAYACARCHTQGWSYANSYDDVKAVSGCGALGPSLCGGSLEEQFPATPVAYPCKLSADSPPDVPVCNNPFQDQIDFVSQGSEDGKKYGVHGQGSGKMPGFGQAPAQPTTYVAPDGTQVNVFYLNNGKDREPGPGMLPPDLVAKIVDYERSR